MKGKRYEHDDLFSLTDYSYGYTHRCCYLISRYQPWLSYWLIWCVHIVLVPLWTTKTVRAVVKKGGDVAQLVEHRPGTSPRQVRFPGSARILFPQSQLSVQTLLRCPNTSRAQSFSNICAHVKDLVVHVRVRWIMETLEHPACTGGWVARLCRSWLSPGKATRISDGRSPIWTIQL